MFFSKIPFWIAAIGGSTNFRRTIGGREGKTQSGFQDGVIINIVPIQLGDSVSWLGLPQRTCRSPVEFLFEIYRSVISAATGSYPRPTLEMFMDASLQSPWP